MLLQGKWKQKTTLHSPECIGNITSILGDCLCCLDASFIQTITIIKNVHPFNHPEADFSSGRL